MICKPIMNRVSDLWSYLPVVLVLAFSMSAWAQWSNDPAQNLGLSDIPGADQIQPKVLALSDNGFFVSWFNNNPNDPPPQGYDVYLQRLNATGHEQFPHNGEQIAKLTNTSTEDYGLGIDTQGNSLLAFLDTREGANQQVTVAKVSPTGQSLWGQNGIQVTTGNPGAHNPKIAGTSDGGVVVAWTASGPKYTFVVLQKFDANGNPQWPAMSLVNQGIILSENKADYIVCDLHAAEDGSVIVSFSRDTGFRTDRYLYANKISASGKLLWGSGHVKVFTSGTLQSGNFPRFVYDGAGGAVFAWYTSAPALQSFVQHINADGTEAFLHNGVPVSTNASQVRVSPSASYNAQTKDILVSWEEEDPVQSMSGVYAQRIDATGTRQWTDNGLAIVPLQVNAEISESTVQIGNDAFVFWIEQQVDLTGTIQGVKLDTTGAYACSQFSVSSVQVSKLRLATAQASNGNTAIAFQDYRYGNFPNGSAIFIQNVNPDCTLGNEGRSRIQ